MRGRILILTGESPERPGGVEHFVREATLRLQSRGYSIEVFHGRNSLPLWLSRPKGKTGRYIVNNLVGYFIAKRARQKVDDAVVAIISNGDLGWCAPKPRSTSGKRIHIYHGTYRGQAEAIRPFISHRGYLYLKWWSSGVLERLGGREKIVLCNSEQTEAEVRRYFGWGGRVVWLPLDLDRFRPHNASECRRKLGLPEHGPCGLFVGSANPAKGFGTIRRVIAAMPEVRWILVMGGASLQSLDELPNARVFRNVPEKDLPSIYSAADFMICPSYYESFGYVVAEGMACGTPVIASPGGASRKLLAVPPLDRLLVSDPASADDFVAAVREVLSAPEAYRRTIQDLVRPKIVELMSSENWWQRFSEATGL